MPEPKKKSEKKQTKPGLRMNELKAATGLPRSTLVYWLKEGLLPEPVRTNRTMAYYDPACVERAALITKLQALDMPLNKIRTMLALKDKGIDVDPLVELHHMVFHLTEEPKLTLGDYCEATGLSPQQVRDLVDAGLLLPQKKNRFNNEDVTAGLFYAWGIREELGITLKDLEYLYQETEKYVDQSIELSIKATRDMPFEKAAEVKMQFPSSLFNIRNYLSRRIFWMKVSTEEHARRSFTDARLRLKTRPPKPDSD